MLIFLRERLVFFATPKTASTSIELALGTTADIRISKVPNAKHTPMRKYRRLLEPFVETLVKDEMDRVAMIREPQDWLGSWYRYRARDEIRGNKNSTADVSFDAFVEAYMSDEPPSFARVGSQAVFLSDKDGTLGMTHLFRYEDLSGLHAFLQKRLNKEFSLGHANRSPDMALTLSEDLQRRLRDHCARDYELYERLLPGH